MRALLRLERRAGGAGVARLTLMFMLILIFSRAAPAGAASRWAFTLVPDAGLGVYHPSSTKASDGALSQLELRVVDRGRYPFRFERLEYGITSGTWNSAFESISMLDAEVLAFYGATPALPFPHELFYGIGAGASQVTKFGAVLTRKPLATFSGGIALPVGDWSVEARVKLIAGTHDELFDVSGTAVTLTASTMLEILP